MRSFLLASATVLALGRQALAVGVYGQCGGQGYSGSTVCDAGSACVKANDWYSQCLPGAATTTAVSTTRATTLTTTSARTTTTVTTKLSTSTTYISTSTRQPTSTIKTTQTATSTNSAPSSSVCPGSRTKFTYFGVNESGAEFGNANIPGVLGKDYTWPSPSSIDFFVGKGMNTFRIPFQLERLIPPSGGLANGALDATYLSGLKTIVNYITGKGAYAMIEPHNFQIYNGAQLLSTSDFGAAWKKIATEFKSNSNVMFDLMNEPHDIPAATVAGIMQAGVDAVRSTGATQLILVEGTSWTGAWTWSSSGNADAFKTIKDPLNNLAIEMHQYLDSDGSGTSPTCVSSTIGAERIAGATEWLKANNYKGFLGEIGAGSNDACIAAVKGALCAMQQSGVWLGALWWAAGPWWGDYYQSIEPPSSGAIARILPEALLPFV